MTRLNDYLVRVNIDPGGALAVAIALALLTGVVGAWMLWRTKRLLRTVSQMDERIASLSNSLGLLTDTTEACFRAVSMQMQFMQSQQTQKQTRRAAAAAAEAPEPATPRTRQRRVVGAARRGEAIAAIAAREELSESEVALRLHVNGGQPVEDTKRYGALLS
jgi:pyruvate/2-oxoglutarate dehydrogenase complex dihydrolipoamide acyltransferase (E2) component